MDVEVVSTFERDFIDHIKRSKKELLDGIRETGKFEDSTEEALTAEVAAFKAGFLGKDNPGVHVGHEADPGELEHDIEQDQIKRQKR